MTGNLIGRRLPSAPAAAYPAASGVALRGAGVARSPAVTVPQAVEADAPPPADSRVSSPRGPVSFPPSPGVGGATPGVGGSAFGVRGTTLRAVGAAAGVRGATVRGPLATAPSFRWPARGGFALGAPTALGGRAETAPWLRPSLRRRPVALRGRRRTVLRSVRPPSSAASLLSWHGAVGVAGAPGTAPTLDGVGNLGALL